MKLTVRGRTRTVEEWARWRQMTIETLIWRLEHGWEAADAVLVPVRPAATSAAVTAFGRTLTPGEWERENGVPAALIGKRIKLGWTPEDAVSRPVRPKRAAKAVTVGGETLAIHEWSERTGIPTAVISSRLSIGWTPERAVSQPTRKRRRTEHQGVVISGERLTIREWSERTGIPESVISKRLNRGWTPERAVRTPVGMGQGPKPNEVGGEAPTVREWSKRTGIPANIIHVRLSRGWTLERAVGTPARKRRGPDLEEIAVGGETLTIRGWSERTGIPINVISGRLHAGWTPGRAVGTPARKRRRTGRQGVVVGGERLTIREWSERTGIPANVISNRLNRGWTPERAVGTPVRPRRRRDA